MLRDYLLFFVVFFTISLTASHVQSNDSLCAEVKIEILQELTLERQGFEAIMRITNSLDTFTLDDVSVSVNFSDELGNPVVATSNTAASDAAFFIRIDDTRNFTNLQFGENGFVESGKIAPKQVGELRWLIIPTASAAGQRKDGKLYFVGAELSYSYGGKKESVKVAPDTIVVKPQPLLTLDYFLTEEIVGDDAFTPEIEAPEPYVLGVRINNTGFGYANSVKIESAQPTIIENEQGLAVDFRIIGSYLNDLPSEPTLLINFGSIDPQGVTTGRWIMQSNLSGKFTSFNANFTHADELGGELTSLLEATNPYLLVHDVVVDLPGRDGLQDFLAYNAHQELFLFESENTGTQLPFCLHCSVVSQPTANYQPQGMFGQLLHEPVAGFSHIKVQDPFSGTRLLEQVVRSDGKTLHVQNAWFSKERAEDDRTFNYYLNIFDANSTGDYRINWGIAVVDLPQPPVIQYIADRTTYEGGSVGFLIQASDPNNTTPLLSVKPLPTGASFANQESNVGIFQWQPAVGQAGNYTVTFIASDGIHTTERMVNIRVNPHYDIDGDGIDDQWELDHFGNLDRDGTDDADGDGRSDLQEFNEGTNPVVAEVIPGTPKVLFPIFDADTLNLAETPLYPLVSVTNAVHSTGIDSVSVTFEIYSDEGLTELIASATMLEGMETTEWQVSIDDLEDGKTFEDNQLYYWRARAHDNDNPLLTSTWVKSRFFINTVNDAPTQPGISSPADKSVVSELSPELIITNASDVDRDRLYYSFAIYEENNPEIALAEVNSLPPGNQGQTKWRLPRVLKENSYYLWQALVTDEHGLTTGSVWSSFLVSTANDAPTAPMIALPEMMDEIGELEAGGSLTFSVYNATDPERQPLQYFFEVDQINTFDGELKIISPAILEGSEQTTWQAQGLQENIKYFWRVRVSDGALFSPWVGSEFTVVGINEAPSVPTLQNPVNGSVVATLNPLLEINPALDPEGAALSYEFQLFADEGLLTLLDEKQTTLLFWTPEHELINTATYYWRVRAKDAAGLVGSWSNTGSFTVTMANINQPPQMEFVLPSTAVVAESSQVLLQWIDSDPDSSATIALYYHFEDAPAQLLIGDLSEDADGEGDQYLWDTSGYAAGSYTISAVIADEDTQVNVTLCCEITVLEAESEPIYTAGLLARYYGYMGRVANLDAAKQYIDSATPEATFSAISFNYNSESTVKGLGINQHLIPFIGDEAASLKGNIYSASSAVISFSGQILLPVGKYRFRVTAREGYRIQINNGTVGEHLSNGGANNRTHSSFNIEEEGWQDISILYWAIDTEHRLLIEMSADNGVTYQPLSHWGLQHQDEPWQSEARTVNENLLSNNLLVQTYAYDAPYVHVVTLNEVINYIQANMPEGSFISTQMNYGPGTGGLGNNNLISFLGADAATVNFSQNVSNSVILHTKGYIKLPQGTYWVRVYADDGYQIKINNRVIAEKSSSGSAEVKTYNSFMINDEGFYELDMTYWDNGYGHVLKVEISDDNGETYYVLGESAGLKTYH